MSPLFTMTMDPQGIEACKKPPPKTWKLDGVRSLLPNPDSFSELHILVWEIIDSGSALPLKHRALVACRFLKKTDTGKDGLLVYIERTPLEPTSDWRLKPTAILNRSTKTYLSVEGYEFLAFPPTDGQLRAFVDKRNWSEDVTGGERVVARGRRKPGEEKLPGTYRVQYTPKTEGGIWTEPWESVLKRKPVSDLFPELVVVERKAKE